LFVGTLATGALAAGFTVAFGVGLATGAAMGFDAGGIGLATTGAAGFCAGATGFATTGAAGFAAGATGFARAGATGFGAAGAGFATGIGGAGFTTWGAGLATGATGRATGTGVLFTGTDTLLTAGAGFPFSVCALADADMTVAAINSGTKIFFMISLLYGEDIKNCE
jgi:hypothetical protein